LIATPTVSGAGTVVPSENTLAAVPITGLPSGSPIHETKAHQSLYIILLADDQPTI
jgi:hypothetical protein